MSLPVKSYAESKRAYQEMIDNAEDEKSLHPPTQPQPEIDENFRNQTAREWQEKIIEIPESPNSLSQERVSTTFDDFGDYSATLIDEYNTPSFPCDVLPEIAKSMTNEIAEAALVPVTLAAMNVIGILSASIGGGLLVDSGGGRITPANLYLLGIADSGTGKSRAFGMAAEPFQKIENEETKLWESEHLPKIKKDLRFIEKRFRRIEKEMEKGDGNQDHGSGEREIQDLEKQKYILEKQLMAETGFSVADITKEKLAMTLESKPGQALASLSPDARGVVDVLMGKYGNKKNTDEDIYVSAYSREEVKVSRVTRPSVHLKTPCLTVLWLMQPDKARTLTESEAITDSGLLPRFLFCDSKAEAQYEPIHPREPHIASLNGWSELIADLLETFRANGDKPVTITADPGARALLVNYHNESIQRTRKGGDLCGKLSPYAKRWGENAWRLALVLHAATHGSRAGSHSIIEDTARRAVEIVRWFAGEQLSILAPQLANRQRIRLQKLKSILMDNQGQISLRDLSTNHGYIKEETQDIARQFPEELKVSTIKPEGGLGRPSEKLYLVKFSPCK